MINTILFATGNPAKKKLMAPIFAEYGLTCLTLADVGLTESSPAETGTTPIENALIKARAFHSKTYPIVFGADTGLEIDALNGEPGLKARRWNDHFPDDVDDETWLAYLLKRLEGVPYHQRTACFTSAWALIDPHGNEHTYELV